MKNILNLRTLSLFLLQLLILSSYAKAKVLVEPDALRQIHTIVDKHVKVYPLDFAKNEKLFERIDQWVGKSINLSQAKSKKGKRKDHIIYSIETSENKPILLDKKNIKKIKVKKSFRIKYVKMPQRRAFVKALRIPSEKKLNNNLVGEIGKKFIENNNFFKSTSMDQMKDYSVTNRVLVMETTAGKKKKFIILQRAIFKRNFAGLEVINSKQIVDVHPESSEILAYKNINWTPVDELKGKDMPYLTPDGVMELIEKAFERKPDVYHVTKVKAGMYQTDKLILPVLAVYSDRKMKKSNSISIQQILLIPLVKNIELLSKKKKVQAPVNAKK